MRFVVSYFVEGHLFSDPIPNHFQFYQLVSGDSEIV